MSASRNPLADGMIEVAKVLAEIPGRRAVQQVALRRAISTAYYAVFHAFSHLCGQGLGLWRESGDDLARIYRNLDHGRLQEVLETKTVQGLHPDLSRIGLVVRDLRKLREDADYSPPGRIGESVKLLARNEVRELVDLAEEAIQIVNGLPPEVRRSLAVSLTIRTKRRS